MDDLFNEVMIGIFLGSSSSELEKSLEILNSGSIDIHKNDNQLFRELKCGRLTIKDTVRFYEILIEKYLISKN